MSHILAASEAFKFAAPSTTAIAYHLVNLPDLEKPSRERRVRSCNGGAYIRRR